MAGGADRRPGRWFEDVAEHLGEAYLRYSFTKGTDQEVDFLWRRLGLAPGSLVLDAGCGPGRHARALTARGARVVGLDLSAPFCRLVADGDPPVAVVRADIRQVPLRPGFDAVVCLCQGGFGVLGGPGSALDDDVVAFDALAAALRPGGRLAISAFSSYFQVRHQLDADEPARFDADAGVVHERTVVKDPHGVDADVDLWTTGFTPRELRLMAAAAGLDVDALWSVTPGGYAEAAPTVDEPELLLLARKR